MPLMNYKIRDREEMILRVMRFTREYASAMHPAAAALVPSLADVLAKLDEFRVTQVTGEGDWRGSSAQRRQIARELRQALVDIAQTGRILGKTTHPKLAGTLKLGKKMSYSELEATAGAWVKQLTPIKPVFVARGFPGRFPGRKSPASAPGLNARAVEPSSGAWNERVRRHHRAGGKPRKRAWPSCAIFNPSLRLSWPRKNRSAFGG